MDWEKEQCPYAHTPPPTSDSVLKPQVSFVNLFSLGLDSSSPTGLGGSTERRDGREQGTRDAVWPAGLGRQQGAREGGGGSKCKDIGMWIMYRRDIVRKYWLGKYEK